MTPTPITAPPPGEHRLVVRSIGRAPLSIHRPLLPLLGLPAAEVVGRLYRAPAILLDGVEGGLAEQLAAILREGGLDAVVEDQGAPFEAGTGDKDVALHLREPGRLREVAAEVGAFLGCDLSTAARVVWSSPALLVGQVSDATVAALRARLEPLGVALDVSARDTAAYDLFLAEAESGSRAIVVNAVRGQGLVALPQGPLVAVGLNRAQADLLWRDLHASVALRLVDQDFERFDVRLDRAPATPAVQALLVAQTGMPARVAAKVLTKLPIVLHEGLHRADAAEKMADFAELGAEASAHLLTFQTFQLVVESAKDSNAVAPLLAALIEQPEPLILAGLRRPPLTLKGPFTPTQARWLREELVGLGVGCRLELR